MSENCWFCLDELFLPVQMECFACFENLEKHCFSTVLTCKPCADYYLSNTVEFKCPFCRKEGSNKKRYKLDWRYIQQYENVFIKCRREGCHWTGTHSESLEHWSKKCKKRPPNFQWKYESLEKEDLLEEERVCGCQFCCITFFWR